MKRKVVLFFATVVLSSAVGLEAIKQQLNKNKNTNNAIQSSIQLTEKQMRKIKKTLKKINVRGATLRKKVQNQQKILSANQNLLKSLKTQKLEVDKRKIILKNALSKAVAQFILMQSALKDGVVLDGEAVIKNDILEAVLQNYAQNIVDIGHGIDVNALALKRINRKIAVTTVNIKDITKQQQALIITRQERIKALGKLENLQAKHKKQLFEVQKRQNALKDELDRLIVANSKIIKIKRKFKSNYDHIKTTKYRGKKTIPPLTKYTIVQGFGPYFKEEYNLKMVNRGLTLKPKNNNARVKNVLNGRVIVLKYTPVAKNIVIVEHPGKLYILYANMQRVSPYLKVGQRIKKGATIGSVDEELQFEIRRQSSYINPLEVIKNFSI